MSLQDVLATASPPDRAVLQGALQRGLVRPEQVEAAGRLAATCGGLLPALRARVLAPEQRAALERALAAASGRAPDPFLHAARPEGATVLDAPSARTDGPPSGRLGPGASAPGSVAPAAPRPTGRLDDPPVQVGPYRIERQLGRGGMGVVYLAVHPSLGRRVALKLLPRDASAEAADRFLFEAQAAARLRHPNIVGVLEVGASDGQRWLAMDLIEGRTLHGRVGADGPLPEREAAAILEKLARAVAFAHARSILHRDIKPHNVLLDAQSEPFLADFGLAKELSAEGARGVTVSGQMLGTPAYMPPEQAGGQLDLVDRRADVYSLGATLYEALTGRPPFEGESAINVVAKLLTDDPVRPRRWRPDLDPDLETMCLKCLEKAPDARYRSADALAQDLARWLAGEPIEARPVSALERLRRVTRRNPAVAGVVAVALVLLLALWGVKTWEISREGELNLALARKATDQEMAAEAAKGLAEAAARRAELVSLLERAYGALAVDRPAEASALFAQAARAAEAAHELALKGAADRGIRAADRARAPRATLGEDVATATIAGDGEAYGIDRDGLVRLDLARGGPGQLLVAFRAAAASGLVVAPDRGLLLANVTWTGGARSSPVAWDLTSRAERWRRDDLAARSLALSADGGQLAVGTEDAALLLDPGSGATHLTIRSADRQGAAYRAAAQVVAFVEGTPGLAGAPSQLLLVGWEDGLIGYFDPVRGGALGGQNLGVALAFMQPLHPLRGRDAGTNPVVVGDQTGNVSIVDLTSPIVTGVTRSEAGPVRAGHAVRTSEDGVRLAVVYGDGTARVWRLDDDERRPGRSSQQMGPREVRSFRNLPDRFQDCDLTPDGGRVLLSGVGQAELWDASDARLVGVGPAAVARDGRLLRREASTQARRILRLGEAAPLAITPAGVDGEDGAYPVHVSTVVLGAADARAYVAVIEHNSKGDDEHGRGLVELQRHDLGGGGRIARRMRRPVAALALTASGELIAGLARRENTAEPITGEVVALSADDLTDRRVLGAHAAAVRGIAVLPGGRDVVSAGDDGAVIVWPEAASAGALLVRPALEDKAGAVVRWTPDATPAPSDATVATFGVLAVAVSPDGRRLATGTMDGAVRLWDLPPGPAKGWGPAEVRFRYRVDGHRHRVVACAFLPDGQRLVSVSSDGVVRVWDLELGRCLRRAELPTHRASGAALAPDGASIYVWAQDALSQVELRVD